MSQANVELARRGFEAFVAGDWDTWSEAFDPEIEWEEMPGLGPDASAYRGVEQVREAVESWTRNWTDYTLEVLRYVDAGDHVVALVQERGRGISTGAEVERESGQILTFRDGRLIRTRLCGSWSEALEAVGLAE